MPEAVVIALIQLSNLFDALCSKELVEADLNRLSSSIREAICRLRVDRHERIAVNEPPSSLSIFAEMDCKRRGQTIEIIEGNEMLKMRHYIISNCDEARPWIE